MAMPPGPAPMTPTRGLRSDITDPSETTLSEYDGHTPQCYISSLICKTAWQRCAQRRHRAIDRLTSFGGGRLVNRVEGRRPEAAFEMAVFDPDGLHERVDDNRADHLKPHFSHR